MSKSGKVNSKKGATSPAKKRAAPKKNKLYDMPEAVSEGTILTDVQKNKWRIGASIGVGGFGEIYLASKNNDKNYNCVVKVEPSSNGPLFVEMHFYLRQLQVDNIERFKEERGLSSLGVPNLLGSGSQDINGIKHRFLVLPRYGSDIQKFLIANNGRLPEGTIYRIAIQMLDVFEYIHSTGYVHADLKAQNILIGTGKEGANQTYLLDYGMVARLKPGDYKPDPKKMHNGTIEYTSRDAHLGITTMRADLEIMLYNLIEWLGGILPWVKDKLLKTPVKVQNAKEKFMLDVCNNIKKLFPNNLPVALKEFSEYVASLKYEDTPNYEKCRRIFQNALKVLKIRNSGELIFKFTNKTPVKKQQNHINDVDSSIDEIEEIEESDDENIISSKRPNNKGGVKRTMPKAYQKSPIKRPLKTIKVNKPIPSPRETIKTITRSPKETIKTTTRSPKDSLRKQKQGTPIKANFNINPTFSINSGSSPRIRTPSNPGKTIINDSMTPPGSSRVGKTYEFNFELDVSMDANVIVNVKRKKRAHHTNGTPKSSTKSISQSTSSIVENNVSPRSRAKLRKINTDYSEVDLPVSGTLTKNKRK